MKKKPTEEEVLQALLEADAMPDIPFAEPAQGNAELGEFTLQDLADHARGLRVFSQERLAEIRCHPLRRRLLAAFERELGARPAWSPAASTIIDWIHRWRKDAGLLQPLAVGNAKTAGPVSPPTYTLLIEREGLLLEESSIEMVFAPQVTERGMLVFQVALSSAAAELVHLPSIRADLSVFAAAPELSLGRIEVTGSRIYVKVPLPPEVGERPEWRDLRPGGPLPFALILHVSEVQLEAATSFLRKRANRKSSRSWVRKLLLAWQ